MLKKGVYKLFHLKYTHNAESCFKNNKETSEIFKNRLRKANEYGVTINSMLVTHSNMQFLCL